MPPASQTAPTTPHVTVHLWTVAARTVPAAILRMAADRAPLRRTPGLRFAKLVGTGRGRTFTVRDADPCRWGLVAAWEDPAAAAAFEQGRVARAWAARADETWRVDLTPVSSRGCWAGLTPFEPVARRPGTGPVAALTRARLVARRARTFWRAVPPVTADLHTPGTGLRLALGIGEAPIGLQGTFSVWDDAAALRAFAYGRPEHQAVVRRTAEAGWYAEELFARFTILSTTGTIDGVDPGRSAA